MVAKGFSFVGLPSRGKGWMERTANGFFDFNVRIAATVTPTLLITITFSTLGRLNEHSLQYGMHGHSHIYICIEFQKRWKDFV